MQPHVVGHDAAVVGRRCRSWDLGGVAVVVVVVVVAAVVVDLINLRLTYFWRRAKIELFVCDSIGACEELSVVDDSLVL